MESIDYAYTKLFLTKQAIIFYFKPFTIPYGRPKGCEREKMSLP